MYIIYVGTIFCQMKKSLTNKIVLFDCYHNCNYINFTRLKETQERFSTFLVKLYCHNLLMIIFCLCIKISK